MRQALAVGRSRTLPDRGVYALQPTAELLAMPSAPRIMRARTAVIGVPRRSSAWPRAARPAVLAHMAFIPAFSGDRKRAEEARDKIRATRTFARRGPASPEMLAWLDAVQAEVETRFGNTRKALQLIHHGEDIFATEEPRPSPS